MEVMIMECFLLLFFSPYTSANPRESVDVLQTGTFGGERSASTQSPYLSLGEIGPESSSNQPKSVRTRTRGPSTRGASNQPAGGRGKDVDVSSVYSIIIFVVVIGVVLGIGQLLMRKALRQPFEIETELVHMEARLRMRNSSPSTSTDAYGEVRYTTNPTRITINPAYALSQAGRNAANWQNEDVEPGYSQVRDFLPSRDQRIPAPHIGARGQGRGNHRHATNGALKAYGGASFSPYQPKRPPTSRNDQNQEVEPGYSLVRDFLPKPLVRTSDLENGERKQSKRNDDNDIRYSAHPTRMAANPAYEDASSTSFELCSHDARTHGTMEDVEPGYSQVQDVMRSRVRIGLSTTPPGEGRRHGQRRAKGQSRYTANPPGTTTNAVNGRPSFTREGRSAGNRDEERGDDEEPGYSQVPDVLPARSRRSPVHPSGARTLQQRNERVRQKVWRSRRNHQGASSVSRPPAQLPCQRNRPLSPVSELADEGSVLEDRKPQPGTSCEAVDFCEEAALNFPVCAVPRRGRKIPVVPVSKKYSEDGYDDIDEVVYSYAGPRLHEHPAVGASNILKSESPVPAKPPIFRNHRTPKDASLEEDGELEFGSRV